MALDSLMTSIFCSAAPAAAGARSLTSRAGFMAAVRSPSTSEGERVPACKPSSAHHIMSPSTTTLTPFTFAARRSSIMQLPSATDLLSLELPSLHCCFPALLHADYEAVKEECDGWIEKVADPPSATTACFLRDCLLPLLVCRFIPKAISHVRLVHVIKAIAWLMIADDDDDHPDVLGSDYSSTSHRAALVMAILHGVHDESSLWDCSFLANTRPGFASKSARMLRALAGLWQEICKEMPPSLQMRFVSTMADYFEGVKVQAGFREEVSVPHVESYIEIRRQASFVFPCFVLLEYGLGIEVDEATLDDPLVQELQNVACDYINLCNDVVSCPLEIGRGDYFNLPCILHNSTPSASSSFRNAIDAVVQMAHDLNTRALLLISTIQSLHHEKDSSRPNNIEVAVPPLPVHAYVEGLCMGMAGALAWYYETARYQQQHANGRT